MAPQAPDLVAILEAAYAIELAEPAWLRGLVAAMRPAIEDGLGIAAYVYDTSSRPITVRSPVLDCPVDSEGLAMLMRGSTDAYVEGSWLSRAAATASETPGFATHQGTRDVLTPAGIRDVMVVNALDHTGVGCFIGAPRRRVTRLGAHERERWERVAAHLRSALRLRLRLEASEAEPRGASGAIDAWLTPEGEIAHAEPDAARARGALRAAVRSMDHARRVVRQQPDVALASWRSLVSARWTLIDEFRADGTQYLVARANHPVSRTALSLTARELQVVACLSRGLTAKVVAYELGLSPSTVRVLVMRASRKLGAGSTAELVKLYRASVNSGP